MQIVCPCCNEKFPIEAAINDVAARKAIEQAFKITTFGDLLLGYVQLFKPAKQALSLARLSKLLEEMVVMIKQGTIERNGRLWAAPQAYWQQAIQTMLASRDKLTLPLKSHGYLFEIIAGYANKAEAKAETKAEQGRIYGRENHIPEVSKKVSSKSEMPDSVRATIRNLTGKKD